MMNLSGNVRARELNDSWSGKDPAEVLRLACGTFGSGRISFATSFGAEDQVITDLLHREKLPIPVFTIDTGRLHQETYDLFDETLRRYGTAIDVLFPEASSVVSMVRQHGPNLFYESAEKRRECCRVRKLEPLKERLSTQDAWICGLRREQSITRTGVEVVEWDESFGLIKINPLADASEAWVWDYIRSNAVPYNRLHDLDYPSIGCLPCTRSVKPGEDIRSGRWWWERSEHRECGLHQRIRN
jgi:phosphoadenosine phosphosulfate reductase